MRRLAVSVGTAMKHNSGGMAQSAPSRFGGYRGGPLSLTHSAYGARGMAGSYEVYPSAGRLGCCGTVVCYTDGSCLAQGPQPAEQRKAGIGVYFGEGHAWNVSAKLPVAGAGAQPAWPIDRSISQPLPAGAATNNRAELAAVILAVEAATRNPKGPLPITICSENEALIRCAAGGWQRKANTDLWSRYDAIVEERVQKMKSSERTPNCGDNCKWSGLKGHPENCDRGSEVASYFDDRACIRFVKVPAHCGLEANERADELAKAGALVGVAKAGDRASRGARPKWVSCAPGVLMYAM